MRCWFWSKLRRDSALGVDESELGCELPQYGDGGGLVVDEDAAFAGGLDLAAEDDFSALGGDAVGFKDVFGAGGGIEDAGDAALSAPWRTMSEDALPPMSRASASTSMDLPAPVSPVRRLRPGPSSAMAWSMTA